jgi:hypothetical protein
MEYTNKKCATSLEINQLMQCIKHDHTYSTDPAQLVQSIDTTVNELNVEGHIMPSYVKNDGEMLLIFENSDLVIEERDVHHATVTTLTNRSDDANSDEVQKNKNKRNDSATINKEDDNTKKNKDKFQKAYKKQTVSSSNCRKETASKELTVSVSKLSSDVLASYASSTSSWQCQQCKIPDLSMPTIECESCNRWYHWHCVGINNPPQETLWFCLKCEMRKDTNADEHQNELSMESNENNSTDSSTDNSKDSSDDYSDYDENKEDNSLNYEIGSDDDTSDSSCTSVYFCKLEKCGIKLKGWRSNYIHETWHELEDEQLGNMKYECYRKCGFKCAAWMDLINHQTTHVNKSKNALKCSSFDCQFTTDDYDTLMKHRENCCLHGFKFK